MKMKNLALSIIAAAFMALGCSADRSSVLKVYNWSDYIDEDVISEFETWYYEQTGETIQVIYQTFDINETMLSKIEKGHEDYDVVCPSDYIIEQMLQSDLLLPIDRDFGVTPNYIDDNLSPYIRAQFAKMNGNGKDANDYAVGYMWGTTGILYNAAYVQDDEADSWDIIRNPKFRDKIFIKDSARDVYSQIILKIKEKELAEGSITRDELMNYTSDEDIEAVAAYMREVKELVAGWEADFGKDQMVQQQGYVNLTWSGDAVWAIEEAAELGVDLRFSLPREGFTVWFDGWVIPKYAQNTKAAKYWINFMSKPDIVVRNVDATGYVSSSCAEEVRDAFVDEELDPIDVSYFFTEADTLVRLDPVLYPSRKDIERSTMEHYWGAETPKLIEMWSSIKGDNASSFTYILIAVALVAIVAVALISRSRKAARKKTARRRK